MDRSHDRTPAQAPPAPAVCAPLPARPNLGAADFPVEPSSAANVLGADPLAGYFYPDLIEDPTRTVREALFGAYLYDYAGFEAMLGLTERAARVAARLRWVTTERARQEPDDEVRSHHAAPTDAPDGARGVRGRVHHA